MKFSFQLFVCFLIMSTVFTVMVTSTKPILSKSENVSGDVVKKAYSSLTELREELLNDNQDFAVSLSEEDLNSMLLLANDLANVNTRINLNVNNGIFVFQLGFTIINQPLYINGFCLLGGSAETLIDECKIGLIPISGKVTEFLITNSVQFFGGKELAELVKGSLRSVHVDHGHLVGKMTKSQSLGENIRQRKRQFFNVSKRIFQNATVHKDAVTVYINVLDTIPHSETRLSIYIAHAFKAAKNSPNALSPKKENEAALWAVAILVGSNQFADLIGLDNLPYNTRSTQINGRFDHSLHYVYSMIIELTTNVSFSNKVGLYKELLDSEGGSGFSFDDLVADRAGTKLAHIATLDNKHAVHIQRRFTSREIILLPKLDFPNNQLQSNNFERYFEGTKNSDLEAITKRIDIAINDLEIYKF
ncbi:hypothetical protein E5672_10805 [Alteromonas portus]|uniref:Uncharacterized protein n=1 Tax=Alteromonas portus TaxID=2565549 RepID=A0A4U0ZCG6_9ALTE|nr:hypothetical protein [Alteromonas portus]TKB03519.1 hypothetical protein E5672_10805 [Alteromonas portus]